MLSGCEQKLKKQRNHNNEQMRQHTHTQTDRQRHRELYRPKGTHGHMEGHASTYGFLSIHIRSTGAERTKVYFTWSAWRSGLFPGGTQRHNDTVQFGRRRESTREKAPEMLSYRSCGGLVSCVVSDAVLLHGSFLAQELSEISGISFYQVQACFKEAFSS